MQLIYLTQTSPLNITLDVQSHGRIAVEYKQFNYLLGGEHIIQIRAYASGITIIDGKGKPTNINTIAQISSEESGKEVTFFKVLKSSLLKFINVNYFEISPSVDRHFLNISINEFLVPTLDGGYVNLSTFKKGEEIVCIRETGGLERKFSFNSDLLNERFEKAKYLKTNGYCIKQP